MAPVYEATTMLDLIILLTWACLCVPVWKNQLFVQLFFAKHIVVELCNTASLCFCPGLFEALQAGGPPSVEWFKSLPTDCRKRWGIYAVVYEKPGCIPLIYIGSGTDAAGGVTIRRAHYRINEKMAVSIQKAIKDGYTMSHFGLLIWCPIPSAKNVPMVRLLFLAMEAALSFAFWTMRANDVDSDWGMSSCCSWFKDRFSAAYRGLCSHSPMIEKVDGDFDLSTEQLEAMAAAVKEKKRAADAKYRKEHPEANAQYYAEHRDYFYAHSTASRIMSRERSPERWREEKRQYGAVYRAENEEKVQGWHEASNARIRAEKRYYCATCNYTANSPSTLAGHNAGRDHKRAVEMQERELWGELPKHYCEICHYGSESLSDFNSHKKTKKHLKNVADFELAAQI